MSMIRRTLCVAAVVLALGGAGGAPARGAEGRPPERQQFQALLGQAGSAYERGDRASARATLHKAARLIYTDPWAWVLLGFVGQGLFCARFVVQWLASERKGQSVVPLSFWYLSIFGSLVVLIYAVWRWDPVFMLAYTFNSVIYVRNLMLIHRPRQAEAAPSQ